MCPRFDLRSDVTMMIHLFAKWRKAQSKGKLPPRGSIGVKGSVDVKKSIGVKYSIGVK